jgi:competence protein ComFC
MGGLRWFAGELGALAAAAFAVFVPPLCVACQKRLEPWERWLCRRCDLVVSMGTRPRARWIDVPGREPLVVRYGLEYRPEVSRLVWEMKYGGKPGVAAYLAGLLWLAAGDALGGDAVLVPVPIHAARRRERGYNQAEVLGGYLADLAGLPVAKGVLRKKRNTPAQAGLQREARLRSVAGSIRVGDAGLLEGRRAVLLDDVVTTGSTLRECALALADSGVKDIVACAVASSC